MTGRVMVRSRRLMLLIALTTVGVLGFAGVASASSYAVNDTTDAPLATPSNTNCVSTHGGTCTLRAAVQASDNSGGSNVIYLPSNTYTLSIPPSGSSSDPATGDLDVNSKDNGTEITILGQGSKSTTINVAMGDRAFSVQSDPLGNDTEGALTLQGLTIQNGHAVYPNHSYGEGYGGAIYSCGALTLNGDVTLNSNTADYDGGGIYQDDCGYGLLVRNSTITNNKAPTGYGGGIFNYYYGTVTVTGSTISGNNGGYGGGGMYDEYSPSETITHDVFIGNSAPQPNGYGGGMYSCTYVYGGSQAGGVDNDEFDNNTAQAYGGGADFGCGATSNGSSFTGNSTTATGAGTGEGGGVYLESEYYATSLVNATVANNTSQQGGGVYIGYGGPDDLVNDTIYHNAASGGAGQGGGIGGSQNAAKGSVGTRNTIVANNSGGDCGDNSGHSTMYAGDAGFNLDSDGSCFAGTGAPGDKPGTNPRLGGPAYNGGPVKTDAETSTSPTIDAGTNQNCPSTDARGVPRPQGNSCDMGAYETAAPTAQLSLSKTAPVHAGKNAQFNYTINVGNKGPQNSTGTTVVDPMPAGTTVHSITTTAGSCSSSGSPPTVTCHLGTLVNGEGATVTVRVSISKTGTKTNTATVSNDQGSHASGSTLIAVGAAGKLGLAGNHLRVHKGRVYVRFNCVSKVSCNGNFSITTRAKVGGTLATISCTKSRTTFHRIKPGKHTVSAGFTKACAALLHNANNNRLKAKLTARPRTGQIGLVRTVWLYFG